MVLVNWNSQDGLDELIKEEYSEYVNNGTLKYFYTIEPKYFHMSKAKNLAHSLGDNEFLYNLDADEYLGIKEILFLNSRQIDLYRNAKSGRIMIKKSLFKHIGGYREDVMGWGHEDDNLIDRCKKININCEYNNKREIPRIEHFIKLENTEFNGRRHNNLRKKNKQMFDNTEYQPTNWSISGWYNFIEFIKYDVNLQP